MSRYMVTGGAGFIGSHTVQALLQRGDEVVCLDNFDPYYPRAEKERNLREVGESPRLRLIEGDVCDPAAVDALLAEHAPEIILHLAAKAGVRPSIADPAGYMHVNACGTLNLLQSAVQRGVKRVVFTSSSSVYGGLTRLPFSEDQETMRPLSPYAASKLAAEMVCHAFHHLYKLPVVILRLFTVYGPRQRPDLAISKFSRLLAQEQTIPVLGDGQSSRDYTYVGDTVRGILAAADSELGYATINLGSARPVELRQLIETLAKLQQRTPRLEFSPADPADMAHTHADISLAKRLLQWEPQVSLEDGLQRFLAWRNH